MKRNAKEKDLIGVKEVKKLLITLNAGLPIMYLGAPESTQK